MLLAKLTETVAARIPELDREEVYEVVFEVLRTMRENLELRAEVLQHLQREAS